MNYSSVARGLFSIFVIQEYYNTIQFVIMIRILVSITISKYDEVVLN